MSPVFLIVYVVIVTLVLTLVLPRLQEPSPQLRQTLLIAAIAGAVLLLVLTFVL